MCSCDDGDFPAFYSSAWVRAKKAYRCYGCRGLIEVGAYYRRDSGKWDLTVSSFAVCLFCDSLEAGFDAVKDDPHCVPGVSMLRECLLEEYQEQAAPSGDAKTFWSKVHTAARASMRKTQAQLRARPLRRRSSAQASTEVRAG